MQLRRLTLATALLIGTTALLAQSLPDAATATQRVESALEGVKESTHNRVIFNSNAESLEQMLSDYQPRLSMQQVESYRAQLQQYRAEYQQFADAEDLTRLAEGVSGLEQQWRDTQVELDSPDTSPNSRTSLADDLRATVEQLQHDLKPLPAAQTIALARRIEAVAAAIETKVGAADAAAELASLDEYWQRDTADAAGWEQEQAVDFATYTQTRSEQTAAFGLPKTLLIFQQANQKLAQAKDDGNAPASYLSKLEDVRKRSRDRLLKAVDALVATGTAKDQGDARAREAIALLDESLRVTLSAAEDAEFGALSKRTQAWLKAAADADTSSEEGRARYYQQMTVSAKAAWPDMERQFSVVRGFDPGNPGDLKGQLIRIETDNLMGWRFKTGDFPFATTISGMPVAATYDGEVEAAIAEVEGKLGRALGDSDDDGRWTIIAEVTGRMGKMQLRKQIEGDIRDSSSGEKLGTYSGEQAETVDAPILRIVAAHVGPLAVARSVGAARADGSLASAAVGDGGGATSAAQEGPAAASSSWLARIPTLLLGLLAAALCWVQAQPEAARALAAGQGQAGTLERMRPALPWVGAALVLVGVYWLLRGLIVGDLLPALALIATGGYCALPLLQSRGLLAAGHAERIRPLGTTMAIAAVAIAGAHLLIGNSALI